MSDPKVKVTETDAPIVSSEDEQVKMTFQELKAKYLDRELAHLICEHMKKDGRVAMHLFVTLCGLVGCTAAVKAHDRERLGNLIGLCGELCADAAAATRKQREEGKGHTVQ